MHMIYQPIVFHDAPLVLWQSYDKLNASEVNLKDKGYICHWKNSGGVLYVDIDRS